MTFGGGALFALLPLGDGLKCSAAAHFLKDAFGVEQGFQTFQSAINGLGFLDFDTSHGNIGMIK